MNRRKLLGMSVQGIGAIAFGAAVIPSIADSLSPALREEPDEFWIAIGAAESFPVGEVTESVFELPEHFVKRAVDRKSVYVWRKSDSEFVVFSRSCTDLGCPVVHDKGSQWFFCPCHGGVFDQNGERRAGPPKRPLWRYEYRLTSGQIEIDLKSVPPMV